MCVRFQKWISRSAPAVGVGPIAALARKGKASWSLVMTWKQKKRAYPCFDEVRLQKHDKTANHRLQTRAEPILLVARIGSFSRLLLLSCSGQPSLSHAPRT